MSLARLDDAAAPGLVDLLPARADTDSWVEVVANVARLAQQISGTSFVPRGLRNDVSATTAAILYGREVGFPPMTALSQINVIEGRPSMSSEAMRALVLAAGHELVIEESTGARCVMRARRNRSTHWTPLAWTIDDARKAGLLHKDNWAKYPRAMLVARCTSDLCRMVFPDVIHGFRSAEEAVDLGAEELAVEVDPPRRTAVRRASRPRRAVESGPPITDSTAPPAPSSPPPPLPGEEGGPEVPAPRPPADDSGIPPAPLPPPMEPPPVVPTMPPPDPEVDEAGPRMVNRPTLRLMFREFNRLGVPDEHRDRRIGILAKIARRPIASSNDLTQEEATRVVTMLTSVRDLGQLRELTELPIEDLPEFDVPLPMPDEEGET